MYEYKSYASRTVISGWTGSWRRKIKTNGAHGMKQNDLIDCEWKYNCMQTDQKKPETLTALNNYDLYCIMINSVSYDYKSCFHTHVHVASKPLL